MEYKIIKSAVANEGKSMRDAGEKIENISKRIDAVMDRLSLAWTGEASEKFITQFRTIYLTNLKKAGETYQAHGEYLKNVKNPYDALDRSFKSQKIGK